MGAINPRVLQELRSLQTEGSPGFLAELIDLFLKEAVQHRANLQAAVERRDAALLERAAHTFKGSSGNLGAEAVCRACAKLQTIARTADWTRAAELVAEIEREYADAESELRAERSRP